MDEQSARRAAQVRGAALGSATEPHDPLPEGAADPLIERTVATCGQVPCCGHLAAPETLDGQRYAFKPVFMAAMPMPCGGSRWIPKPELLRQRRKSVFPPAGLQQFQKPPK